ncbi:sensor histidine kinase regulating citrate/malate metabolism [Arthrobacter sp. PL16]|uniref:sensor histidine kinase n=1 Tax=Arthrobacter sp. PL16 TaxID=3071720 RepID=UPI002E0C3B9F|nr:sensor histidine kinase regulating citrate/malate metabolism [Arthrobacter sp. PL16]
MIKTMSLRSQLFLLQLAIVLVIVAVAGSTAVTMQRMQIREQYEDRMVGVAQSVAQLPSVIEAFDEADPSATIQPIADLIRQSTGVTYVVVTDEEGIRYSHPNPDLIGRLVSTDPSVPLSGKTFVGTQTGTLGESWRVKVPIYGDDGGIIGTASVGTLESELDADLYEDLPRLLAWLIVAALVGSAGAIWISRLVWRRIYRLEPEQIASLLETRDAMIHGISEGMVAVDEHHRIALLNDEAKRLLDLDDSATGQLAEDVMEPALALLLTDPADTDETVLSGERVLLARTSDASVDGTRVGRVMILRDRTELYQLLTDLDGERDATQALRAQAHEFANRMHTISGLLELGRTEQAVDFISRSGHGGSLVSGTIAPGIQDPDAASLLMTKSTIAAEKGITLSISDTSTLEPDGTTDVVTILGILIDNAIEAVTGSGRTDGRITVHLEMDADALRIEVSDNGPGIAAEDIDGIFSSGYSTKDGGHTGTRGFGLALVDRIARRRSGQVVVDDAELGGAEFTVWLAPSLVAAPRSTLQVP